MNGAIVSELTLERASDVSSPVYGNATPTYSGGFASNKHSLQVTGLDASGAKATPTSLSVVLQGSLDNLGGWTTILTHSATDGSVVGSSTSLTPYKFLRIGISSLTLGATAVKIHCTAIGMA